MFNNCSPFIMIFAHHWNFVFLALASFAAIVLSASIQELVKRGVVLTSQRASEWEANGRFLLENNLWGQSSATSGSQSTQETATNGNIVSWQTTYNWVGGMYKVKSFANLDLKSGLGTPLSSISTIPTAWDWEYTNASPGLSANVAYDMWLSNSPNATGASLTTTFEVMVWISSRGGATPYGTVVGSASINGVTWKLYKGAVANWIIFSFLAPNEMSSFSSDLRAFFTYLIANQGVSANQYLVQLQGGTEAFVGQATLTTSSYSVAVNS